jgi:hypothetical protein
MALAVRLQISQQSYLLDLELADPEVSEPHLNRRPIKDLKRQDPGALDCPVGLVESAVWRRLTQI